MLRINHDILTGQITEVPLAENEVVELETMAQKASEQNAAIEAEIATKAAQKAALLAKLDITEDEARLLLG